MPSSQSFLKNITIGISGRIKKIFHNPYRNADIGWFQLKRLKHLPPGKLHSQSLQGKTTWFKNPQEYLHGIKEIFVDEIYKQVLPATPYIIDCGAHIGLSVIYLKSLAPEARILAFEPDRQNFSLLQKNIQSHGLENIELKNEAVWYRDEQLNFLQEGNMGSRIAEAKSNEDSATTKGIRLKNYLDRPVDFLKLDIESAEYQVLKDLDESLLLVRNLFIEYHGSFQENNRLTEILELLVKHGFRFYIKEADRVFLHPFLHKIKASQYDLQLNIFCFRK